MLGRNEEILWKAEPPERAVWVTGPGSADVGYTFHDYLLGVPFLNLQARRDLISLNVEAGHLRASDTRPGDN